MLAVVDLPTTVAYSISSPLTMADSLDGMLVSVRIKEAVRKQLLKLCGELVR